MSPPRIVLLEDDPLVRCAQNLLLGDLGYRVVDAASLEEARASLKDDPADVAAIIADADLGMKVTGPAVAIALARDAGHRVPILILSSSLSLQALADAATYGLPVEAKPVSASRLQTWLAGALGEPG